MPKRRGRNISQAERLRGLLKIVAIDGDERLLFDENTVAGLGFTELEQRQLIAAYKIRITQPHYVVTTERVTLENAERIWAEWQADKRAAMAEMLEGIKQEGATRQATTAALRGEVDDTNLDEL